MNHYVEPTDNCRLYPVEGLACSSFTGIKTDLPLLGGKYINIGHFQRYADRIDNGYLEEIVSNVPVMFPYPNCDYYFLLILSIFFQYVCARIHKQRKIFVGRPVTTSIKTYVMV